MNILEHHINNNEALHNKKIELDNFFSSSPKSEDQDQFNTFNVFLQAIKQLDDLQNALLDKNLIYPKNAVTQLYNLVLVTMVEESKSPLAAILDVVENNTLDDLVSKLSNEINLLIQQDSFSIENARSNLLRQL